MLVITAVTLPLVYPMGGCKVDCCGVHVHLRNWGSSRYTALTSVRTHHIP